MPGVDGYELARCMRQDESLRTRTIIAVIANPDEVKAKIAGFDDHLTKPADPNAIKRILVRRQAVANWEERTTSNKYASESSRPLFSLPFRAGVVDYLCGCRLNHWLWTLLSPVPSTFPPPSPGNDACRCKSAAARKASTVFGSMGLTMW